MAVRQLHLSPEAEPILDSVAESVGGNADLALSELLIAHESIESFLDELESSNAEELIRLRDRSALEFGMASPFPGKRLNSATDCDRPFLNGGE